MVRALFKFQLKLQFCWPVLYGLLALYTFVIAVYANQFSYQFVQLQSGNTEGINLSSDVFAPLNSLSMLLGLILLPLVAAQLHPRRVARGIQRLVDSYPVARSILWFNDWLCLIAFILACQLILFIVHLPLLLNSNIDWPVYLLQLSAHGLTLLLFATLTQTLFARLSSPLIAIISSFGILFVFWLIPVVAQWPQYFFWLQPFNLFEHYRQLSLGLLALAPLGLLLLGVFFLLCYQFMSWHNRAGLVRLAYVALALLIWLASSQLTRHWDLTSNKRFSLQPLLVEQLAKLSDDLTITSYGLDETALDEIQIRLLNPLQRNFPHIEYQKINTMAQWENREQQGLLFEWQNQQVWIGYPFTAHPQQLLLKSLVTLNQRQQQWIMFSDGHQEAQLAQASSRSLSILSQALQERGFKFSQASLRQLSSIPENTQLFVIASSRNDWLPTEQQALLHYLQAGGNLLWLRDPEDHSLTWLEDYLGVVKIPGTLIDPVGYDQGTPHPAVVLIDQYDSHPLLQSLGSITALPWASGLSRVDSHWQVKPLMFTNERSWTELQPEQESLSYDEELGELKGRFPTMMVLQRQQGLTTQSVVVTGDSHFLSDQAINNYDNKQLALNLFYWLTQTDSAQMPQLARATDRFLNLSTGSQHLLNWFNPFVFPVLLLATGLWLWRRRKNQ